MRACLRATEDGRYVDGDDAALEMLGVTREQLLAARIGDFSGPHADLAREVWRRLAPAGQPMPTGEATMYRIDGSPVRVRYLRIAPVEGAVYEIVMEQLGDDDGPPVADRPSSVLERWRDVERQADSGNGSDASSGREALRELYQYSVKGRSAAKLPGRPSPTTDREQAPPFPD